VDPPRYCRRSRRSSSRIVCRSVKQSSLCVCAVSYRAVLFRMRVLQSNPVKPHGHLVRLGCTCCHASTCRLSTWSSPTALQGSCDPGGFILGRVSHLDAFSGSPVPAWLPGAAFGNTAGTPEASPSRSSRTKDGFPQSSNAHDGYRPNCLTTF